VLAAKPLGESLWGLSPREQSIGELLALGLTNKVIAFELGLSEPTVKMHIRSIFRKLGAANRTQVAAAFQENDLVVSGASRETIDRSARSITSSSPTEPKGRIQ
jgi:DNA-binding NarL/FixJ family response regulator